MPVPWSRMIRFVAADGRIVRGEPILPDRDFDLGNTTEDTKLQAKIITGDDLYDNTGKTKVSDEVVTVKELLGPLTAKDVDTVRCVGLNYATHIKEAGRTPPPFPFIFFKPTTSIHDHNANIKIPKIAQDNQADYEGELVLVIGKDAKDVPLEKALDFVAAYTVGNDISARKLQRNPELAGRVPQWGFSKGFDTFAPIGPALIASELIGDPKALLLQTIVDGEIRQKEYGTTLRKGSLIMTGTPGGVGAGLVPPKYLVPGTIMEVSVSNIGTLRNTVEFE